MKKVTLLLPLILLFACNSETEKSDDRIRVFFDTDANNELDDQHALAYLLSNADVFNLEGVTVNATRSGGEIENHYAEAERILTLYNANDKIDLISGANADFESIISIDSLKSDGAEAVNYIIEKAKEGPYTLIAVGKLTNVALAVAKDPEIVKNINLVWLGSNYPEPGEYNQDNDTISMNYLLNTELPFEMVTVRYGEPSGTDAVKAYQTEINKNMPGLGPKASKSITGRHGGEFSTFGDYAVNLFEYIDYHGTPPSRPLFDMVAVAILKNPEWGKKTEIPAPVLINNEWIERPQNPRKITIWENFDRDALMADFYDSIKNYQLNE
ncbi:nucleoside hydrolase [Jiulongibacter sp. NS-SX5]|uniref:nucleoside hydrolase n=1 Tax=Jiulongibacter sp. NS-SX5 TaxID=3463854 RepID=UPI00405964ED